MAFFLSIFFLLFSVIAYADPVTLKQFFLDTKDNVGSLIENKSLNIEAEVGTSDLKQRPLKLLQSQNEKASVPTAGTPYSNSLGGWGEIGGIGVGYKMNPESEIKVSFESFNFETKNLYNLQAGNSATGNPSATTLVPFIDGSTRSSQQAAEVGGQANTPGAQGDIAFKYENADQHVNLDYSQLLLTHGQAKVNGIVGLGYAYFDQNSSIQTNAIDVDNGNPSSSYTYEDLTDNLVGLRLGLEGKDEINSYVLDSSVIGSFFYRRTNFDGYQHFTNSSLPFTGSPSNFSTSVTNSKDAFTSCLEGKWGIIKKFKYVDVGVFYVVDVWFNMSTIVNPTVSYTTHDVIDHPARIGNDNTIFNSIMVKVSF